MFVIKELINTVTELTQQIDGVTQETDERSERESKKAKMKSKAVPDILNSSLEAIEKTQGLEHAVAALKSVSTTFMTPAGAGIITSALVTVSAQLESHLATGETDMTEQVNLAGALAALALAMAKQAEAKKNAEIEADKKLWKKPKPKPKPDDAIRYILHFISVMQTEKPNLNIDPQYMQILHNLLETINKSLEAVGEKPLTIQEIMRNQVLEKRNQNGDLGNKNHPAAFSTKIPKPGDIT